MRLTEWESKQLLSGTSLQVLPAQVLNKTEWQNDAFDVTKWLAENSLQLPVMVKAQTLHGNRGLDGLVVAVQSIDDLQVTLKDIFHRLDQADQPVSQVLIEPQIQFEQEFYLSLSYSTRTRRIQVSWSQAGGSGMDDRADKVASFTWSSISNQPVAGEQVQVPKDFIPILKELVAVYFANDMVLLEINPLVKVDQTWIALDAKAELDDVATFRHPEWQEYPSRTALGRDWTEIEKKAHAVSQMDHRGVAGESYFQFVGGTIGVMASGGGASTLVMDALLESGLKPANYTEYSGNPTRQKVAALAEVVLSQPNLEGLLVVGSTANFTDIYETLAGFVDGFENSSYAQQPGFAIVIRRGGPRWQEAFQMVQKRLAGLPVKYKLFGPNFPIVQTVIELKNLLIEY